MYEKRGKGRCALTIIMTNLKHRLVFFAGRTARDLPGNMGSETDIGRKHCPS